MPIDFGWEPMEEEDVFFYVELTILRWHLLREVAEFIGG